MNDPIATEALEGFLLINKPKGITSFNCIQHLRRILGKGIKIGHAGTLDPFATGLLIIAINRTATRRIHHIMQSNKTYCATAKLGELTDTFDLTGTIQATKEITNFSQQQINDAIATLGDSYIHDFPMGLSYIASAGERGLAATVSERSGK